MIQILEFAKLRALCALMPHVLSCPTGLVDSMLYVLSCLTYLVSHMFWCFTCLIHALVPHVSCALHVLEPLVPRTVRALVLLIVQLLQVFQTEHALMHLMSCSFHALRLLCFSCLIHE